MKTKIICLFVFFSITFGSFGIAAKTAPTPQSTMFDDDVPTWNIGDSWTYTIDDFTVDYSASGQSLFMDGTIDDFTWTVRDTSGSDYLLEFEGEITADYVIYISSSTTIYVEGSLTPGLTRLSGTLTFTKSDLQLKDLTAEIRGLSMARIDPLPFNLPIPFKISIDGDLSTEFPILDFPLNSNKFWNLPTVDITMKSTIGGLFGLVSFPVTFTTGYTWTPLAFHCHGTQSVTTPAGTYTAYKITSIFGDFFEYYYAPVAGNLIKIDANMPNGNVHGELKSTTFS